MKHLFVSYETAKVLKELGFDEPCLTYWHEDFYGKGKLNPIEDDWINSTNGDTFLESENCTAPTYQQVVDWFREKQGIFISITLQTPYDLRVELHGEGMELLYGTNKYSIEQYYAALNAAIDEAIKLIKK